MTRRPGFPPPDPRILLLACGLAGLLAACGQGDHGSAGRPAGSRDSVTFASSRDWNLKAENLSPRGSHPLHFSLEPGFRYALEQSTDPKRTRRVEVKVLEQTEPFDLPGVGRFECAVVQTDELQNGAPEGQMNEWLAIDTMTQAVYSFGAVSWEVDSAGGKVFAGMWRAGEGEAGHVAEPALVLPGRPVRGERNRAVARGSGADAYSEVMESGVEVEAPAGKFTGCVRIREVPLADPDAFTDRWWCPGVGLVRDGSDGALVASDVMERDSSAFGRTPVDKTAAPAPTRRISLERAKNIALKEVPGEFRNIELEQRGNVLVYTVEIIAKKGGVETDVFVDVATGKVIATER